MEPEQRMPESVTYGNMSSEAVEKATGRGWVEWIRLIDEAGVADKGHTAIAAWLNENHIESGWWAQAVTIGYEQARGLRAPNQRADGYTVSISKTIPAPVSRLYEAWIATGRLGHWLGGPAELDYTTANPDKNLRARWPSDNSLLMVYFYPKSEDRTQVVVQVEQMQRAEDVEMRRAFWKEALARLQESCRAD